MTYYWCIKVFDDVATEDDPARSSVKGTGSLDDLTRAVAAAALELEEDHILDISVDPIPSSVTA